MTKVSHLEKVLSAYSLLGRLEMKISIVMGAILATASMSYATMRYDPMTFTLTSPSVSIYGSNPATIYGLATNVGQGFDVNGVGPITHILSTDYGAMISVESIGFDNVLDISNNEINGTNGANSPNLLPVLYYSVSADSLGLSGTEINHQAVRHQQGADRFTSGVSKSPWSALTTGSADANFGRLSINQTYYNAIPSLDPFSMNNGAQDDADGLEVTEFKFANPNAQRSFPIFFNFDVNSPSMLPDNNVNHETWVSSDVLVTPVGSQAPQVFASGSTMGLSSLDIIDGLAVYDVDNDGVVDPGSDVALFSLRKGSPSLGVAGRGGDIFVTDFQGSSELYVSYSDLGLLATDELDALDVDFRDGTPMAYGLVVTAIPEPTTLLAFAGLSLMALRRR